MIDDNKMFGISMLLLGLSTIFVTIITYIAMEYGIMYAALSVGVVLCFIGLLVIYFNRKECEK